MKKYIALFIAFILIRFSCLAGDAAVVTPEPLAAEVGIRIMKKGGNAFDAAVAMGFTLAVTYPRAGNIGGGGFAMLFEKGNEPIALDFREKAPLKASRDIYLDEKGDVIEGKSTSTVHSTGVPGSIKGLYEIWEKYGTLPFGTLLEDAIKLADQGHIISEKQHERIQKYSKKLQKDKTSAELFFKNTLPLAEGDRIFFKNLAKSLKTIGEGGEKAFYNGELGKLFVKEIQKMNGLITSDDLKQYQAKWRTPVKTQFRNDTLYLMPLPSSGGIVISQILKMLENYNLKNIKHNSLEYMLLLTELEKRCYADRNTYLGDPDFFPVAWEKLLDETYLKKRLKSIVKGKPTPSEIVFPGYGPVETSNLMLNESDETTSFAVTDTHGNCVSITYTLNGNFGCGITLPETGILLNNEMDDFSIKPGTPNLYGLVGGKANAIEPGKRMLSSMTPAIVTRNGEFKMVLGSPGGSRIITTVLQTYLNHTLFNMNAEQAVNAERFHHQWLPDEIRLEDSLKNNPELIKALETLGIKLHFVEKIGDSIMILNAGNGKLDASADKRGRGNSEFIRK